VTAKWAVHAAVIDLYALFVGAVSIDSFVYAVSMPLESCVYASGAGELSVKIFVSTTCGSCAIRRKLIRLGFYAMKLF
jgi:hypothetical protein